MRPGFVKIVFDYPFHIGVPDGFYPVAVGAEEVGLVQILSKEGKIRFLIKAIY